MIDCSSGGEEWVVDPQGVRGCRWGASDAAAIHRHLTFLECEEISCEVVAGEWLRVIASRLGPAASTVSRESTRNGVHLRWWAHRPDRAAWKRARRPQRCTLATNPALREAVCDAV